MTRHQFFPACPPFVNTVYKGKISDNINYHWIELVRYIIINNETKSDKKFDIFSLIKILIMFDVRPILDRL